MIADCVKAGLPEPDFEEKFGGFAITFSKNIFTESSLKELGLNERQVMAVLYVKENGAINNSKYQQINDVGKTTATEELRKLVDIGLLTEPTAKGRGAKYELKN